MTTSPAFDSVHDACVAFQAGEITEDGLIQALSSLPIVKQAPLPDEQWFDAVVVEHGPVYQLRREAYRGTISSAIYSGSVQAMLDAGHAA
jgi:hypothetical protein